MREIHAGMAEVVKYGFIADRDFLFRLDRHFSEIIALEEPFVTDAIRRSAEIKSDVVEKDFREESGLRATLNFGHTFAHGLEKLADYRYLRHGEAVTIGMVCALSLSHGLGYLNREELDQGVRILRKFRFPHGLVQRRFLGESSESLLEYMLSDKKKLDRKLRFVLLKSLGSAFLLEETVEDHHVLKAITEAKELFKKALAC